MFLFKLFERKSSRRRAKSVQPTTAACVSLESREMLSATFTVSFDNNPGWTTSLKNKVETQFNKAANVFLNNFQSHNNGNIQVQMRIGNPSNGRVEAQSLTNASVGVVAGVDRRMEGAAYEFRYGTDPNGSTVDATITFNLNYLKNELWFGNNANSIPNNKFDGRTILLHELGHIMGMNAPTPTSTYKGLFDYYSTTSGGYQYFTGTNAVAANGGFTVPVTYGNPYHIGNLASDPVTDDLMNGVSFDRGRRYNFSALDKAIFKDLHLVAQ